MHHKALARVSMSKSLRDTALQGLTDDWRVRLAFPLFQLIDFLLARERIARYLFENFRTKDNIRKVLQVSLLHAGFRL
jgi:hypothetical protein